MKNHCYIAHEYHITKKRNSFLNVVHFTPKPAPITKLKVLKIYEVINILASWWWPFIFPMPLETLVSSIQTRFLDQWTHFQMKVDPQPSNHRIFQQHLLESFSAPLNKTWHCKLWFSDIWIWRKHLHPSLCHTRKEELLGSSSYPIFHFTPSQPTWFITDEEDFGRIGSCSDIQLVGATAWRLATFHK